MTLHFIQWGCIWDGRDMAGSASGSMWCVDGEWLLSIYMSSMGVFAPGFYYHFTSTFDARLGRTGDNPCPKTGPVTSFNNRTNYTKYTWPGFEFVESGSAFDIQTVELSIP
jgi:hypothetical protein